MPFSIHWSNSSVIANKSGKKNYFFKKILYFIRTLIVILDLSDKAAFDKTKCFEKVHLGGNYQIYQ